MLSAWLIYMRDSPDHSARRFSHVVIFSAHLAHCSFFLKRVRPVQVMPQLKQLLAGAPRRHNKLCAWLIHGETISHQYALSASCRGSLRMPCDWPGRVAGLSKSVNGDAHVSSRLVEQICSEAHFLIDTGPEAPHVPMNQ